MSPTPYYDDGQIQIFHGDWHDIVPSLPHVDLVLTDPPYGIAENTHRARARGRLLPNGKRHQTVQGYDYPPVYGDDAPFDPSPWLGYPRTVLWGANHYASRLPDTRAWFVWDKREGGGADNRADCELAWTNLPGPARLYHHLWRGLICRGEENAQDRVHPTQKPIGLMAWCLSQARLSRPALVLDPYMGSGPTLVAAKRAGYRAIGIEIEERYCEIAVRRLAQQVLPLEVG